MVGADSGTPLSYCAIWLIAESTLGRTNNLAWKARFVSCQYTVYRCPVPFSSAIEATAQMSTLLHMTTCVGETGGAGLPRHQQFPENKGSTLTSLTHAVHMSATCGTARCLGIDSRSLICTQRGRAQEHFNPARFSDSLVLAPT